ncbi:MAG TPA: hypothetical protein VIG48_09950 [Jatrophihabitans sp.]
MSEVDMIIDCDTCIGQGVHCHDCVISVLLNAPPQQVQLESEEQIALVRLADAGLVPPLRLVRDDPGCDARAV